MKPTTERDPLRSPFTLSQWLLVAVGTGLSGTAAAWYLHAGGFPADSAGTATLLIALCYAQGGVAFGGLTLHLLQRDFNLAELKKERNGVLAGIAALAVACLAFHGFSNGFLAAGSAVLLPLPLLVVAAFKLSPAPASVLAGLWCVSAVALAHSGEGPFAIDAGRMNFTGLGIYNIVMAAVIQLVAAGSSGLRKAEAITLARGYQKAKLHSLQANLSPHFLFNTLNVIRALVYADPGKADQAITSLAGLLRRSLRTSEVTLIDLGDELEQIEVLLRLARLRYHDRLQTHIQVPDHLLGVPVPPMLLFNLVENAITHGIGSLELGGMITISAGTSREQVRISIRNSGTLDGKATRGNGTKDALQRLEMLFGGEARFSLSQIDEKTVSADVDLPLSPNYQP